MGAVKACCRGDCIQLVGPSVVQTDAVALAVANGLCENTEDTVSDVGKAKSGLKQGTSVATRGRLSFQEPPGYAVSDPRYSECNDLPLAVTAAGGNYCEGSHDNPNQELFSQSIPADDTDAPVTESKAVDTTVEADPPLPKSPGSGGEATPSKKRKGSKEVKRAEVTGDAATPVTGNDAATATPELQAAAEVANRSPTAAAAAKANRAEEKLKETPAEALARQQEIDRIEGDGGRLSITQFHKLVQDTKTSP